MDLRGGLGLCYGDVRVTVGLRLNTWEEARVRVRVKGHRITLISFVCLGADIFVIITVFIIIGLFVFTFRNQGNTVFILTTCQTKNLDLVP